MEEKWWRDWGTDYQWYISHWLVVVNFFFKDKGSVSNQTSTKEHADSSPLHL